MAVPTGPAGVPYTEGDLARLAASFDLSRTLGRARIISYFITKLALLPTPLFTTPRVLLAPGAVGRLL